MSMAEKSQVKQKSDRKSDKPHHPARRVKSQFIDFDPTTESSMYRESVDERVDYLIRIGLGDPAKLAYYRQAIDDPRSAVKSALYREMVADVLSKLMTAVLSDPILFNRVKTLLLSRGRALTLEQVVAAGMELRSNK